MHISCVVSRFVFVVFLLLSNTFYSSFKYFLSEAAKTESEQKRAEYFRQMEERFNQTIQSIRAFFTIPLDYSVFSIIMEVNRD